MALDRTTWFMGGGAWHSPEVARAALYASTNGAEGVSGVDDLKITAQPVPTSSVRSLPGGGLLLNRYPGGTGQTYGLRNASSTDIPINPTGSSGGRTDLIVARVLDPQYEGLPAPDPLDFDYARYQVIESVPATATARSLGLSFPAIDVARITLPGNTATVTDAMITDLRKVARPRRERFLDTSYWQAGTASVDTTGYKNLGSSAPFTVPTWAAAAKCVITYTGAALMVGNSSGWLRGVFNGIEVRPTYFDENWLPGATYTRCTYVSAGEFNLPAAMRGNSYPVLLQGLRDSGPGYLQMRSGTSVVIDIEFSEKAY